MSRSLEVARRPVDALIPYARNARTHSDDQVAQIAASIREFGWTNPVLLDEADGIIAGHGRVLAARKLGEAEVPCIVLTGLTEVQRRAYVLADNKLALNAGWDFESLGLELQEIDAAAFDVSLTGFSEREFQQFTESVRQGLTDENDAPEAPAVPVSVAGDLWELGAHRLLCGDATVATDVARVLGAVKPLLMVTDPPYGVNYDPDWRNQADRANGRPLGASAVGLVTHDDRSDWREAWSLFPGDVVYCWHAGVHASTVQDSLTASGFVVRSQIVWAKSNFAIGRGDYHVKHEPCWYAVRKGKTGNWSGDRTQSTLWEIPKPMKSETGHSTQKPVECMRRPIVNNSSPGQAVYEPFSGSGTTIIAAEQTGRVCLAIEIEPAYVDVAVQRWQAFTGDAAVLAGDGRTFGEIAATGRERAA